MVNKCSVTGCMGGSLNNIRNSELSFHAYPLNNLDLCEKWNKANPRKDFRPSKCSRICSLHFLPSDFEYELTDSNSYRLSKKLERSTAGERQKRKLKKDAVPSIFPNVQSNLRIFYLQPQVIEAMNIAKKSTTRNGVYTKSSNFLFVENLNGNKALSPNDTQSSVKVITTTHTTNGDDAENGVSSATQDAGADDVIICDVELPHSDSKPTKANVNGLPQVKGAATVTAPSLNSSLTAEPTKRSLDNSIENASKKVRLSISASQLQQNITGPPKPKIFFMTFEQVESLVRESLKQESLKFQKEISERFEKEITDLKSEIQLWKTTASSLKSQLSLLKNKKKNSPCNLPPVSANPLMSQHLKMLHNNSTSAVVPNVQVSNLLGLTSISPQLNTPPVVIQPQQPIQSSKLSSVIDLTDEDDASKKELSKDSNKADSISPRKEREFGNLKPFSEIYPNVPPPPSPLADQSAVPNAKGLPPRPVLSLTVRPEGVVLTWDCPISPDCEDIVSFHLLSYQLKDYPDERGWKRVGNIKAMPLPMVCTLEKSKLERHAVFALRGEDQHCRIGLCSNVVILDKEKVT